nr:MAG TPA: hypothetical protein [Caudoviricetes sp.]
MPIVGLNSPKNTPICSTIIPFLINNKYRLRATPRSEQRRYELILNKYIWKINLNLHHSKKYGIISL